MLPNSCNSCWCWLSISSQQYLLTVHKPRSQHEQMDATLKILHMLKSMDNIISNVPIDVNILRMIHNDLAKRWGQSVLHIHALPHIISLQNMHTQWSESFVIQQGTFVSHNTQLTGVCWELWPVMLLDFNHFYWHPQWNSSSLIDS